MAQITTTFQPEPSKFGFTGIPNNRQDKSDIPRQEIFYTVNDGLVPAAVDPLDTRLAQVSCVLPFGFVYVLTDVFLDVTTNVAGAVNFNTMCTGLLRDDSLDPSWGARFVGQSFGVNGDAASGGNRTYDFTNLPSWVVIPKSKAGANLLMRTFDPVPGGPDAFITSVIRVLQYDVSQAHNYQVNTPTAIR